MQKRTVTVKFTPNDSKAYAYWTPDVTIKHSDKVVVEVRGDYAVATVYKTFDIPQSEAAKAHSWIVQKVNILAHEKFLEEYAEQ